MTPASLQASNRIFGAAAARRAARAWLVSATAGLLGLLFSGLTAAEEIPALPEIQPVVASARPWFVQERARLVVERSALRAQSDRHNANCRSVEEGTPAEAQCSTALATLRARIDAHIRASKRFIAALAAATEAVPVFEVVALESRGEFYLMYADGRKVVGTTRTPLLIDSRTTIITGADAEVRFVLPDETYFTIGPNSEILIDDFVYDPQTSIKKISLSIAKGFFRWVTGKVTKINPVVKLQSLIGGIRGTDFECSVSPDGSGFIKLYSGGMLLTPKDGGAAITLKPGEMITFTGSKISGPMPIPAGSV